MKDGHEKQEVITSNKSEKCKTLTHKDHALAGSASGVVTRLLCQPFDVVKIRFQLQIKPISLHSGNCQIKYVSILQAFKSIFSEEGIAALWKGHVPAQGLSVLFSATQFTVYKAMSSHFLDNENERTLLHSKTFISLISGGTAGSVATILCQPFDVIRTRLVGQGEPKIYNGMFDAVFKMYKQEGIGSFYKGLSPTLLQIAPYAGCMFAFYEILCIIWMQLFRSQLDHIGFSESVICGLLAGMGSKTIVHPLDVVKKQLQIQGFQEGRKTFGKFQIYSGFFNCCSVTFKQEGFKGFYKGLRPSLLKAAVSTACQFTVYEQCCNILRLKIKYSS